MFLGGKNVKISDFGQKKPLNFGEDFLFFYLRSPAFGRKICDFGQKTLAPLILILPPPQSREAGDAPAFIILLIALSFNHRLSDVTNGRAVLFVTL